MARIEGRVRDLGRAGARVELAGGRAAVLEELMTAIDGGLHYGGVPISGTLPVVSEEVSLPERGAAVDLSTAVPAPVAACLATQVPCPTSGGLARSGAWMRDAR